MFAAVGLGLVALAFALYANALPAPPVFDDPATLAHARRLADSPGLALLLSREADTGETTSGRPFLTLIFALNHALGGGRPAAFRAVNIALHALAAFVLFAALQRVLVRPRFAAATRRAALPLAAAIAGLWLVHPLQTQSVTYLSQRAESQAGLLLLMAVSCFLCAAESARPVRWLAASVLAAGLGAATKETAVVAPVLVLLLDRTIVAGSFAAAWRSRGRYYLVLTAVTWTVAAALALASQGRGGTAGFDAGVGVRDYLFTQAGAVITYLGLAIWPADLTFDYGTPLTTRFAEALPALGLVAVLGLVSVRSCWRGSALGLMGVVFFLLLAPSSSVVPVASQTMAEHRMYLPLAAPLAAGILALHSALGPRAYLVIAGVGIALAGLTGARNLTYRSEPALWADTTRKAPDNARAWHNLGLAELRAGHASIAEQHLSRSATLNPGVADTHYNLGISRARQGRTAAALAAYERAVALRPAHAAAWTNLGGALLTLGRTHDARQALDRALQLQPDRAEAHANLADLLLQLGEPAAAHHHALTALRLDGGQMEAHLHAGNACAALGRLAEARGHFEGAVRLRPDDSRARNNLANALLELDRPEEAITHYRKAVELAPAFFDPRRNLALLLLHLGRPTEALPHLEVLLQLQPENPEIARALGAARAAAPR